MERFTRRRLIRDGLVGGASLGMAGFGGRALVEQALAAADGGCASLSDVEHVVILIQENRSFDHYFGAYRGVRGWNDAAAIPAPDGSGLPIYAQPGYPVPGYGGHLYPFHLDTTPPSNGECTNDITHDWGPQHRAWNGGAMDAFVKEHLASDGAGNGPLTMAYYTRKDVGFYYALADAFTICDGYHCSVIGPTDPNRLYSMTGTLDPGGEGGGPHLTTLVSNRFEKFGAYTWKTMPEVLSEHGVSWKVYSTPDGNYGDNVLAYFKAYQQDPALAANAFGPTFPGTFQADCAAGTLPQVSWVLAPLVDTEHPPAPPLYGEDDVHSVLNALVSNPDVWHKTVLFVTWDENGGFFDHVAPPVAPAGTPGEYLTVSPLPSAADGIAGPIGLGFRVPMLVVSPLSRGGFVAGDTFDHTSTLRFLETRFGTPVPNLSAWRRAAVGDLTSALNLARADAGVPPLPATSRTDPSVTQTSCTTAVVGFVDESAPSVGTYPVPPNSAPSQEPGTAPAPSGPVPCAASPKRPRRRRARRRRHLRRR